jgi:DNA-binding NarL/FixJ family response regulator
MHLAVRPPLSAMPRPIRLALVEDHPHLRDRLAQQLAFFDAVELVLVSESGDAFLADLDVRRRSGAPLPEVVLMDIEMPGTDGIATTGIVSRVWPDIEVLMLTVFEDEARVFAAVQAGASGYLLKDTRAEDVVAAVIELRTGGAPTSPLVARKLMAYIRESEAQAAHGDAAVAAFALTPREREVLACLVDDHTEAEIADDLGISAHTIRSHVKNLYAKLQVHSRAQAVRLALEQRLV